MSVHFVQKAVRQKKKGGGQMVAVLSKSGIRLVPTSTTKRWQFISPLTEVGVFLLDHFDKTKYGT